jgi:uncharacterized membrane protein
MTSIAIDRVYQRPGRGLLFVSLAFNLFFLGLLGATAYNALKGGTIPIDTSPRGRIERLAANLPAADRDVLRQALADQQAEADAAYKVVENGWANARARLAATPYDMGAAEAAMAEVRRNKMALNAILHHVVAVGAARMSPEGRAQLGAYRPAVQRR